MKLISILMLLVCGVVFAAPSPYPSQFLYDKIKTMDATDVTNAASVTTLTGNVENVSRVDFDARTTAKVALDTVNGDAIPADSMIVDVKMYVDNILTSVAGNPVSLSCNSVGDLMALASYEQVIYATNYQVQGIPTEAATGNMVHTSAGCTPYASVGTSLSADSTGITDGRLIFRIRYISVD